MKLNVPLQIHAQASVYTCTHTQESREVGLYSGGVLVQLGESDGSCDAPGVDPDLSLLQFCSYTLLQGGGRYSRRTHYHIGVLQALLYRRAARRCSANARKGIYSFCCVAGSA